MEKQPVDDLFARKLRDADVPVGPDLFNQLQKRMGTEPLPVRRTVRAWWFVASAACALIALWFLYVIYKPSEQVNRYVAYKQIPKTVGADKMANDHDGVVAKPDHRAPIESQYDRSVREASNTRSIPKTTYPDQKPVELLAKQHTGKPRPTQARQSTEQVTTGQLERNQAAPESSIAAVNLIPVERIDRVAAKSKQIAERTIILTIGEPQAENSLVALKNDAPKSQGQQNGLTGLFGKLKQLKDGEVLAKAAPGSESHTGQKNRLSRVFTEVKESLKNETTLE